MLLTSWFCWSVLDDGWFSFAIVVYWFGSLVIRDDDYDRLRLLCNFTIASFPSSLIRSNVIHVSWSGIIRDVLTPGFVMRSC